MKNIVKSGMVVLYIGANEAAPILKLARLVGLAGQIHVFQPNNADFSVLKQRFNSRDLSGVILNNSALMHQSGSQAIKFYPDKIPFSLYRLARHYSKVIPIYTWRYLKRIRLLKWLKQKYFNFRNRALRINQETAVSLPALTSSLSLNIPSYETQIVHCLSLDDYAQSSLRCLDVLFVENPFYGANILLGGFRSIRNYRPILIINVCEEKLRYAGYCSHYLLQWLKALGYLPYRKNGLPYTSYEEVEEEMEIDPTWNCRIVFKPYLPLTISETVNRETAEIKIDRFSTTINTRKKQEAQTLSDMRSLRYVFSHVVSHENDAAWYAARIGRLRARGYLVEDFCVTLNPPGPKVLWPELDYRWRRRDPQLLRMYDSLSDILKNSDVLINYNGANLHPDFIKQCNTFNVFSCYDDPEASEYLSRYVAAAFDFIFVGNPGCLDMYRGWGIQNVEFLPIGVSDSDRDLNLSEEKILTEQREIPVVFLGSRDKCRDRWIDPLMKEFPQAMVYGSGWPNGYLEQEQQIALYMNSRIGWNMDQSVGPVTSRTYRLPANGVLLIGNNRAHLGKIFDLGVEAIGFDTLAECIEHTHYYLTHEEQRRQIASRGWRRTIKDYTEWVIWQRMLSTIQPYIHKKL